MSARGVAVVTGGSAGVGRAAVRRLAERGWDVAVLARGSAGCEAAAADVRAAGRRALALECDVADADAVEAAADRVEAELGPIDVWDVRRRGASPRPLVVDVHPPRAGHGRRSRSDLRRPGRGTAPPLTRRPAAR